MADSARYQPLAASLHPSPPPSSRSQRLTRSLRSRPALAVYVVLALGASLVLVLSGVGGGGAGGDGQGGPFGGFGASGYWEGGFGGGGRGAERYWRGLTVPPGKDVWEVLKDRRPFAPKRLSWGILRKQGGGATMREALREDRRYSWTPPGAGFNNQVMQIMNMIHMSHLLSLTPILPPFRLNRIWADQVPWDVLTSVAVSEIFDLSHLATHLSPAQGEESMAFVDMDEIKATLDAPQRNRWVVYDGEHEQVDAAGRRLEVGERIRAVDQLGDETVGCWSMGESGGQEAGESAYSLYRTHTPWTPLPQSDYPWNVDRGRPNFALTAATIQSYLASAPSPAGNALTDLPPEISELISSSGLSHTLNPDTQIVCVDTFFGFTDSTGLDVGNEFRKGTGTWGVVGKYMRWQPPLEELGRGYVRGLLGLGRGAEIPPYMAVHIRRSDFSDVFLALTPRQYAHAASVVLTLLRTHLGVHVKHVIATSDESDPAWLDELKSYGWKFVNHTESQTADRYGLFFPTIMDSLILSGGRGFLGVSQSTMSILAYRRTLDWNDGVGRFIEPFHEVPDDWEWTWDHGA